MPTASVHRMILSLAAMWLPSTLPAALPRAWWQTVDRIRDWQERYAQADLAARQAEWFAWLWGPGELERAVWPSVTKPRPTRRRRGRSHRRRHVAMRPR